MRRYPLVRSACVLFLAASLGACATGAGKLNVEFPVPRAKPFDVWSATGAAVALPDGEPAPLINPFDPIALNNMAVAEAARGRHQQALALLQRAVKLAPARADIAANLSSMRQWMVQSEGQAALGMAPRPLQLPYQESSVVQPPPLWRAAEPLPATGVTSVMPMPMPAARDPRSNPGAYSR